MTVREHLRALSTPFPIYVTRKYGVDGKTGQYTLSAWMILLVMLLAWTNAVAWGAYGVLEAVKALV